MRRPAYLAIFLLLTLLLAPAAAQGTPSPAQRLSPWEHVGQGPETGAWGPPGTSKEADTTHPTSLLWHVERVDAPKTFSAMGPRSLALDAASHPHIAYGGDHLYYAWHNGSVWHVETVDPSWGVGRYTSLALDGSGWPHISYYDRINYDLKYARFDGTSWQIETVDPSGYVGEYTSIALDSSGHPHISYHDETNGDLKYARFDGSAWLTETVDPFGDVGRYSSLALDASDRPHISYHNGASVDLKYARFDGTIWQIETVDPSGYVGEYTSIALDSSDRPHISYYDGSNTALKHARFDGTSWQIETVDPFGNVGPYTSLALDSSDRPHISYLDWYPNYDLKYARFDGSAWLTETVDPLGDVGSYTSLALDASDRPNISYYNWTNANLKYARFDSASWQIETVDGAGDVGLFSSLALDSSDRPHISYYDWTNGDLKYARFDGSAWLTETVDPFGDVGRYSSLALDASDRPHISYYDEINGDLKYAYFDGAIWLSETVDSTGWVGEYTSIALDGSGRPHIGYYDEWPHEDLKYARFDGSIWQIETVDSTGDVGLYTSLALDGSDRPHISYWHWTYYNLKYARFDGTSWQIETVDSAGWVGYHTSLALDADDNPHISYYTETDRDLKYARFDGTIWQIETVDAVGEVGEFTSLALDRSGRPHISYWDRTNADLKHARFDGRTWQIETVDSAGRVGLDTSLALDGSGQPHISYYDETNDDLRYAWGECVPVAGASIAGPAALPAGVSGLYTASYTPPTATLPVTLTWDNGAMGPTAAYSWTLPGSYTLTVTATNPCGTASASFAVEVFCQPVEGVAIAGSAVLPVGVSGLYTATYAPPTATLPVTLTWDNGAMGPTATYSWTLPGTYTLTVTATNSCGIASTSFVVEVCQPVEAVEIAGPAALFAGETGLYTATYTPPTATLQVTITWDNGSFGPTAIYSWTLPGSYTLTVTATNACGQAYASFTVEVCQPVEGVHIEGPAVLPVGVSGLYTATYAPPTATLPVTFTWDNGTVGPTATYSWTVPGTHTLRVTATNGCGSAGATFTVTICQPVEGIDVAGPVALLVGETGLYTATYTPPTATLPVTLTWDNGSVGPTAIYSWTLPGTYTLTVTATNPCGVASTSFVVEVCQPVEGVEITGTAALLVGQTGLYTATYVPPTATLPVTFTWDNGTMGPTAAYSWTVPGTYTLTVTATNPCGVASTSFVVEVCQPVEGVHVEGPALLPVGVSGLYTATYAPPTATLPVTLTWDNDTAGPTAIYSWTLPGTYTLTVTATNRCGRASASLTVEVCQPVEGVEITGPAALLVGQTGLYTATYVPPTATLPVTFTWDNGTVGPTAAYSWTVPGSYTLTVTATNPCGQVSTSFVVEVCQPVEGVEIAGPAVLEVGQTGLYTVTYTPPTATLPVTFTWDNGMVGPTAAYSWAVPGSYTLTVTATNRCGAARGTLRVEVQPYTIYLPLVLRGW